MQKRLKITRIIAIIAFVMYVITMILPYTSVKNYDDSGNFTYYPANYGYEFVFFLIFFIPALLFMLLKHNLAMKILAIISTTLLFGLSILVMYVVFSLSHSYAKPNIGFYLFLLAGLLMFITSIIKLTIKMSGKKDKQYELLDNFLI